ncbi:hypothetical protein SKAU_G00335630 [Synaphobranchus kaupii]|uniref:Uncharacterized protein n=1 Tax=Synaphobranchus kaupii TaxID=118154 RepID=A0A9Q1EM53_SYNKA|nr:hypothetical protein SKAU_G00335630 [Synaphobranchus kaupii]
MMLLTQPEMMKALGEQDRTVDGGQASGSAPGSQAPAGAHQASGGSDPSVSSSERGEITGSAWAPRGFHIHSAADAALLHQM